MEQSLPPTSSFRLGPRNFIGFLRSITDPAIAVGCLLVSALVWRQRIQAPDIVLAALAFFICYPSRISFRNRPHDLVRDVLSTWCVALLVLWTLGVVSGGLDLFMPQQILIWALATPIAQVLLHWNSPGLLARLNAHIPPRSVVVVGANDIGRAFARSLARDSAAHARIVGFLDDRSAERRGAVTEAPVFGMKDADQYLRSHRVDQIFIALPMGSQPRLVSLLNALRDSTASVYFVPDVSNIDLIQARIDTLAGFPVLAVCDSPMQGVDGAIKRATDVAIASLALLLLGPLMLSIALLVKVTSPGPAIFRQKRYGMDGRDIEVWKFRSMRVTEDGRTTYRQVSRGDPRVTRLGAFLRKTSLDELPQLVNVLQGSMSMVGPRPHVHAVNEEYRRLISGYMVRHKVRPGITGWAQVNGYRGGNDLVSMSKRVEHDLEYLRNWSWWLDLQILVRTVATVLKDSKAY